MSAAGGVLLGLVAIGCLGASVVVFCLPTPEEADAKRAAWERDDREHAQQMQERAINESRERMRHAFDASSGPATHP